MCICPSSPGSVEQAGVMRDKGRSPPRAGLRVSPGFPGSHLRIRDGPRYTDWLGGAALTLGEACGGFLCPQLIHRPNVPSELVT